MRQIFSAVLSFALLTGTFSVPVQAGQSRGQKKDYDTATPIKHLVVIFGENNSFDHYFGTYPYAQNNPGETPFAPAPGTPTPNGLTAPLDPTHGFAPLDGGPGFNLLTNNPNLNTANGTGAANP